MAKSLKKSPKSCSDQLNSKIGIFRGDITHLEIDAIVNAANKTLLGGGGVDGAIHRAAGKELVAECATLNGCQTGQAKSTCGYRLPAKYVIHTVGPIGEKPGDLASCYVSCLDEAMKLQCRTIVSTASDHQNQLCSIHYF